ncbi:MAG: MerR family transcriptional regulator [Myxococcales bacterium]|nr:MerR family transcriptional regulator [Myxococcales bacterium]
MLLEVGTSRGEANEETGPEALVRASIAEHSRKTRSALSGGVSKGAREDGLLSDDELRDIQAKYENGMTAVQIVEVFVSRGVRFSEASFRKYVQQGLLPRSRRVGRKGKHRGSLGVYPVKAIHRINVIKSLMNDGYTIEEIQEQFLQFADVVENLEEGLKEAFELFGSEVASPRFDSKARKTLSRELAEAESWAEQLLSRITNLSERLSQSHSDSYRSTGAAGSAEDLL